MMGLKVTFLAASFAAFGAGVQAATIDQTPNSEMGCFATLRGVIEKGDAAKVEALVPIHGQLLTPDYSMKREGGRLCFDSPGGSLSEGVAIADILRNNYIGTAVGAGASCESACSIAFMGGYYASESDVGDEMDRVIHPTAKLGFHSPSLAVPEGQYSEEAVNKSYTLALESMAAVVDRMHGMQLPIPLIGTMLHTPPDGMSYIETVGQASIFGVAVAPVSMPLVDATSLTSACMNVEAQFRQEEPIEAGNGDIFTQISIRDGEVTATSDGGLRQELASNCEVWMRLDRTAKTEPLGYVNIDGFRQVYAYQLYPFAAKLSSLNGGSSAADQMQFSGTCVVFSGGRITDQEPCTATRTKKNSADAFDTTDRFSWPSGATTVVEEGKVGQPSAVAKLNGAMTQREAATGTGFAQIYVKLTSIMEGKDRAWACWKNPNSGNYFCFVDQLERSKSTY